MKQLFQKVIQDSIDLREKILTDPEIILIVEQLAGTCIETLKHGGKILFCGNGGSAADAQHLAAELSGRFAYDRAPLASEALHVNSSFLTAVSNDYSFEEAYARMVRAIGTKQDMLIAISTSGNSPNIIKALKAAQEMGMQTAGLAGNTGGKMAIHCNFLIKVPSMETPRIQEVHITIGHILCEAIEASLFPKK